MAAYIAAFECPNTQGGGIPSSANPIDLVHLARQTLGDRAVELDALKLFARQARECLHDLSDGGNCNVKAVAHKLKGAAQAIGAFRVSDAASKLENEPDEAAYIAETGAAVMEAENFILRLSR